VRNAALTAFYLGVEGYHRLSSEAAIMTHSTLSVARMCLQPPDGSLCVQ
jgi:hypothetical protein